MAKLHFSQKVRVCPDTLINVIGEESVLLNLKNEQYYGLDQMGTSMWQALTTSETIEEAYKKLLEEYEVSPDVLRQDLDELLEKLVVQGLLELKVE